MRKVNVNQRPQDEKHPNQLAEDRAIAILMRYRQQLRRDHHQLHRPALTPNNSEISTPRQSVNASPVQNNTNVNVHENHHLVEVNQSCCRCVIS